VTQGDKSTKENENLTFSFEVKQTPEKAFRAINDVRGWWSGNIDGSTDELGDIWTYRYEDLHYCKQKITDLVPGKRVVWHVLDSYIAVEGDKEEWTGTDIVFDIKRKDDKTEVIFTHAGLTPTLACYAGCFSGWRFYIMESLRDLITTGIGAPNQ